MKFYALIDLDREPGSDVLRYFGTLDAARKHLRTIHEALRDRMAIAEATVGTDKTTILALLNAAHDSAMPGPFALGPAVFAVTPRGGLRRVGLGYLE